MAQSTTGRRTRPVDLFPPTPADHPIFKRGFVIGTTRSADFSTSGAPPPAAPKPSAKPTELSQEPSNQEPPEEPMPDEQLEKLAEEAKAFLERKRRQQRSSKSKAVRSSMRPAPFAMRRGSTRAFARSISTSRGKCSNDTASITPGIGITSSNTSYHAASAVPM